MGCSQGLAKLPHGPLKILERAELAFHSKYQLGCVLGQGSFSTVVSARTKPRCKRTRQEVAVKVFPLAQELCSTMGHKCSTSTARTVMKEAQILSVLGKHEHCVTLIEVFFAPLRCFMVLEKCNGNLRDWFASAVQISEASLLRILKGMFLGIHHVHSSQIVHRDVKPDNFLMGPTGDVKLCDFGLATVLPSSSSSIYGTVGTLPYMSPEMASASGHNTSTDVWSAGASVYHLLYGDYPYKAKHSVDMKHAVICGVPKPNFSSLVVSGLDDVSMQLPEFCSALMERSQAKRCAAIEALELPLMRDLATPHILRHSKTI